MDLKAKKILVTGGAGFIGSHLVERLLIDGASVTVIDNFSLGRVENLAFAKGNEKLKIVKADISNHDDIRNHFSGIDWVFHLAALADIVPSVQNPIKYHQANVDGTVSVLEAAKNAEIKRFIYAASSSCYGIPDMYPTPETADIRPEYPYALTKNIGEQYVMHWQKLYGLPAVSTRFFNVFGPRSRTSGTYGAVFGVFLKQKLAGAPFTVVGDGSQTRDFTFVTDVVDAMITAAKSDFAGEIFNVGSGNTYSINRLTELLGGDIQYIPKRPGEPDCTLADIRKIRSLMNWEPKVSFEEGVKIMLKNIDYWQEAPLWDQNNIAEATKDWFKYLGNQ